MLLQKLIYMAPISNCAFLLSDKACVNKLIKECEKIDKTVFLDLITITPAELGEAFNNFQIVIIDNMDELDRRDKLLYRLSCLLDADEPYVFCRVKNKEKFNALQGDKEGPLFRRWFWLDDISKLFK